MAGRARAKAVEKCIGWKVFGSSLFFLFRRTLGLILKSTWIEWSYLCPLSKWKWKWKCISSCRHSRFSTVQEQEWYGFVATNCVHLYRIWIADCIFIGIWEAIRPTAKFLRREDDFDSACSLLWHCMSLNLWPWCWDSLSSSAYHLHFLCLDSHLAWGYSTTSGDNAVTGFQRLNILETCVNQGTLYLNYWLCPSPWTRILVCIALMTTTLKITKSDFNPVDQYIPLTSI